MAEPVSSGHGAASGAHDCQALLGELEHLLHGEISVERASSLQGHLEDCPPCFERADFQAQLKRLVADRCVERTPEALAARVRAMLEGGTTTG